MKFNFDHSVNILQRTPAILNEMLSNLPPKWIDTNEGSNTWSPYDVVGHLIHGEKTDWVPRMEIILSDKTDKKFQPFNRFAQFEESKGKSMEKLLEEFKDLRNTNIELLRNQKLVPADLEKKGIHPDFGEVNLSQLLSAWVVHDLNHIAQISRVMASLYKSEVGPWVNYLGILKQ
ncbi:DinB family protein [Gracilimonas sp.]|uniref:DinB family protein n=1 Tax=Gracilimonas sp. TaxID=1974203 RepID=UPI003BACF216